MRDGLDALDAVIERLGDKLVALHDDNQRLRSEAAELRGALEVVVHMCWLCRDTPGIVWGKPCAGCSRARKLLEPAP